MAATEWNVVPFQLPASTGNFDITQAGVGTPDAVIIVITGANAIDSNNTNGVSGYGFSDGVSQKSVGVRSRNNVSTSETSRAYGSNAVIRIPSNSAASDVTLAQWSSWITDGVRLNILTNAGTQWRGFAIFITGGIANIDVRSNALHASGTASVNVGFQPQFMMGIGIGQPNDGFRGGNNHMNVGIACENYNGDLVQKLVVHHDVDNFGTTDANGRVRNAAFSEQIAQGAELYRMIIQSLDVNGWTWQATANTGGDYVATLAIEFEDKQAMDLYDVTIPNSGDLVVSTNIEPEFNILVGSWATSYGVNQSGITESFSAFRQDDTVNTWTAMWKSDDANTVSYTRSQLSSQFRLYNGNDNTATWVFDTSGRTSQDDGYTLTAIANFTNIRIGWGFSIGPGGVQNFKLGADDVDDMKVGTQQVDAAYLGSTQIF